MSNDRSTADASRLTEVLADRYRVEHELGGGGMATVYLARDLRHDRDVALKVLRSEIAASLGHERFLREIRLVARLNHPHILPLFDSGEAGGFLFFVMPVMQGNTLRDRLRQIWPRRSRWRVTRRAGWISSRWRWNAISARTISSQSTAPSCDR